MEPIYLHDWADGGKPGRTVHSLAALKSDFAIEDDALDGVEILLASYTYEDYSGDAFVLFRKDGQLYEVNGSHCSCYGLEDQWRPEQANVAELRHRATNGQSYSANEYYAELLQVLDALESGAGT